MPARGTIAGIGPESQVIDNVLTGQRETVHSFGWYVRKMIADVRAKHATPILLTLTRTNTWDDGRITCPSDTYRLWIAQLAHGEQVALIDASRIIAERYQREGRDAVKAQFIDDSVHTNVDGAAANARDIVSGLRAVRSLPFRRMLSEEGRRVRADDGPARSSPCAALSSEPRRGPRGPNISSP